VNPVDKNPNNEPEILVNENQANLDPTVVVAEADRTVVLTENDTIVIEKPTPIEIIPNNRPRKVYQGMWGPWEIAAFAVSLIVFLGVVGFYLLFVAPSGRKVEEMRAERDRLEQELISARSKYGNITNIETEVSKLVTSVSDFESTYLPVAANGQTALYQRLNGLIAAYSLTNTNGPNYAPLVLDEGQNGGQSDQEQGRSKFKSIFPGVYVTMSVEGSYQNLRRFINDIETSNEFVIISSVELEPTDTKKQPRDPSLPPENVQQQPQQFNNPYSGNPMRGFDPNNPAFRGPVQPVQPVQQQPQAQASKGKTHGETVSLRLEMAAYFRRPNFVPSGGEAIQ
jgi:hypothetical protein